MAAKLFDVLNPHVPFMVGGVFVLLSAQFVWFNYKHIKLVNNVSSGH
jgi:MFS transporter, ACDE family, multidrug resistance protein